MMIARWSIDARFGDKPVVLESMRGWMREFGSRIGWSADKVQLLTGSVGAPESRIEVEIRVRDLAELNAAWDKLATLPGHAEWSKALEPHVVSGSPRWEVLRVVE